jgi:hypothetical protein
MLTMECGLTTACSGRATQHFFHHQRPVRAADAERYAPSDSLPGEVEFGIKKNGRSVGQINVEFPKDWKENTDSVFCFSYSSVQKRVDVSVNGEINNSGFACDLGIIRANALIGQPVSGYGDYFAGNVALYGRILSSNEIREILTLPFDWVDSLIDNQTDETSDAT